MTRPVLDADHRTALRVLADAVVYKTIVDSGRWIGLERTFFLSFPDDDEDDEPDPTVKSTAKLPVIPKRRGAEQAQKHARVFDQAAGEPAAVE